MDEVIAVEVTLDSGERRYFLTWGRVQDPVDPRPVAELVLGYANAYSLGGQAVSARVCRSLQEASGAPYFYECLLGFAANPIPFGPHHERWREQVAREMSEGRHIAYCGEPFAPMTSSPTDPL